MTRNDDTELLDRHLDAALLGDPTPSVALDPRLAATVAELRQARDVPSPHPAFVAALEHRLAGAGLEAGETDQSREDSRMDGRFVGLTAPASRVEPLQQASPVGWLATAALVLVALAAVLGVLRLSGMRETERAAPLTGMETSVPGVAACGIAPRQIVPAPPRTGSAGGLLPREPGGEFGVVDVNTVVALQRDAALPDQEAVDGIARTVRELVACLAEPDPDPARVFALFSDAYLFFALDMPTMSPPRDVTGDRLTQRLAALPLPRLGPGEPEVKQIWKLSTGQIGAVVRPRAGTAYYVVFARAGDRWLIDGLAIYPFADDVVFPVEPPVVNAGPLELASVAMFDIIYVPNELTVPADQPVTLALTNAGEVDHTFVVDELGIDLLLHPGEATTVELEASPGIYTFYCRIPGHREAGMQGSMIALAAEDLLAGTPVP